MLEEIYKLPPEDIKSVEWTGDPEEYDLQLFRLGSNRGKFMVVNPWLEDDTLHGYIKDIPSTNKCIVWKYNDDWVAKYFNGYWTPEIGYEEIIITKPTLVWSKNPDLDKLMTFEDDPYSVFEPDPWESEYTLVWYLDPRVNPLPDRVWAIRCQPIGKKSKGTKDMGHVMPSLDVEYSEDLPDLGVNIDDCYPTFWDIANECAWELDPIHTPKKRMWVVKFTPTYRKPKMWKWYGIVSPQFHIEYNPDLPKLEYDVDYVIPYHDFTFEHMWMLDNKHLQNGEEEMWAFKIKVSKDIAGIKIVDYVSPLVTVEYNPNLPVLNYNNDYVIPYHDFTFEHMWMLDNKHLKYGEAEIWAFKTKVVKDITGNKNMGYISPLATVKYNSDLPELTCEINYNIPWHDLAYEHIWYLSHDKIWAVKMCAVDTPIGHKSMDSITPVFPDALDVIFISYNEPNAEENWQRVLSKAPYAKRVDGVDGIFNAHKAAAKLSSTDMFYVVDGDAYLVDGWKFDYQPGLFDRDCAYIWYSKNPVNGLVYGYGGVKLFSRKIFMKTKKLNVLDMSTSIMPKLKVIDSVSNITAFNTNAFSTWRSAFRECVKLCYNIQQHPEVEENKVRLNTWLTVSNDRQFGLYALDAANQAVMFVKENTDNVEALKLINNRIWLDERFKDREKQIQMEQQYIKLEHTNPAHADWFVVNWCLGNTCNFKCSYCPAALHDSSIKWPNLDVIKNFISKVKAQYPHKNIYFEFTGGEVTTYKHFIEVCKFCTELGVKVGLISNGSRTIRYWEENKQFFDHVCLSYHPEFADADHFINIVKTIHNDVRTHVNIMMSPDKFSSCYAIANKVKNISNISMALQPLIHDFGDTMYDYTAAQKNILEKQHDLIVKHIPFTKEFEYYRGAMLKIFPDGTQQPSSAHRFVSEKSNDWSGWKCSAGVEQLIVDMDGSIHRGWCKVGGQIGNITDEHLMLPTESVICSKTMCHCNFDIMCTKEKVI